MKDTGSITIPADSILSVSANIGTMACNGKPIKLHASTTGGAGSLTYNWMPGNLNGVSPSVSPSITTVYTVIVKDTSGCKDSASEVVTVNSSGGFDLAGNLTVCIDTPTFSSASIQACIYNNRCLQTNGTLKLVIDTNIHITSTFADSAAHIIGDTLIWNYDSLALNNASHCIGLSGLVNAIPTGDSVFVSMFITPTIGDSVPANNSVTYWVKAFPYNCIGLPFDPNNKSVSPAGNIASNQKLAYTIHFQNTGTGVAKNVVVIDTLSPYLDPTTLEVISSSNSYTTQIVNGHIVKFIFDNINLTDTATSKILSVGVFSYTIMPAKNVTIGTWITNTAGIYFDANPAITTNTVINKVTNLILSVENIIPGNNIACFPNPFTSTTSIVFNTSGKHYIELDDITGRKIENMECTGLQYQLQRNGLSSGIYFIKAYDEANSYVATAKLIVQ